VSFIGSIEHPELGGYLLRRQVADYLRTEPAVDCYGKGIRWVDSKLDALASYRFSVAMENVRADHYFSEKLVDCILTETVPVYWGCPSIAEILDPRGIVFFETLEELRSVLPSLDERRYLAMRPFLLDNKALLIRSDLHSGSGYFRRLAAAMAVGGAPRPLSAGRRSLAAAFLRRMGTA
jgi:hypothetical protein